MKRIFRNTALLIVLVIACSCSGTKSSADHLPPLKIEVPAELKDNAEVVRFIKESEEAINLYTQSAEDLAEDCKSFAGKKEEDLSVLDKVKMLNAVGQFTANFAQFGAKYGEMTEQTKLFEEGMNEEQAAALATVLDAFKNRMQQIEEKYKDLNQVQ